jgi:hypothetical protein
VCWNLDIPLIKKWYFILGSLLTTSEVKDHLDATGAEEKTVSSIKSKCQIKLS